MKLRSTSMFWILSILLCVNSLFAANVNYKWQAGKSYRFNAKAVDMVSMQAMGVNMKETFTTSTTFSVVVKSILANGSADATLYVEDFSIKNSKGQLVASLKDIPKNALSSLVEIDKKGRFNFKKIVYLLVEESGTLLVSGKATPTGASASAQMGDEKVSVHCEFNPKTGQLKAGYSVQKVKTPKKKVAVKQDAQKVDIIPTQFLELLELPEEPVHAGSVFSFELGDFKIKSKVGSLAQGIAKVNTTVSTKITDKTADDGFGDDDMDDGMGGFPDMGMGGMMPDMGMGAGGSGSGMSMSLKMDGSFNVVFDINKGMMKSLKGNMKTNMSGGPMTIKGDSQVDLKFVP